MYFDLFSQYQHSPSCSLSAFRFWTSPYLNTTRKRWNFVSQVQKYMFLVIISVYINPVVRKLQQFWCWQFFRCCLCEIFFTWCEHQTLDEPHGFSQGTWTNTACIESYVFSLLTFYKCYLTAFELQHAQQAKFMLTRTLPVSRQLLLAGLYAV